LDQNPKERLDLTRLSARLRERPRTKAGQVRQAWPEIKALLDSGHSLKDVCAWLNEIGIAIGYARLSDYLGRLKRREQAAALAGTAQPVSEVVDVAAHPLSPPPENTPRESRTEPGRTIAANDPLANVREREDRRPGFQFNSEPDTKKLI
jgi:hypothetical protein